MPRDSELRCRDGGCPPALLLWQMDGLPAAILCQFGENLCYTVRGSRDALMSCSRVAAACIRRLIHPRGGDPCSVFSTSPCEPSLRPRQPFASLTT
jgi:hypothetical protein